MNDIYNAGSEVGGEIKDDKDGSNYSFIDHQVFRRKIGIERGLRSAMRRLSRYGLVGAALCILLGQHHAFAATSSDCREAALLMLRTSAPDGYAIFRETGDPAFFASWIDCRASQDELPTAVHESTHHITAETDAFPLIGGGAVPRPHEVTDFSPPSIILSRFGTDDFTSTYLRPGRASSSSDFLYLLDEFNAYTHDLATAVDLRGASSSDEVVDHRDGLAAMMAFVTVYADSARVDQGATWTGLRQTRVASTVSVLWSQAEHVMARSCGIPNFGTADKAYLARVCDAGAGSAIAQILGRAPACPARCLQVEAAEPAVEQTGSAITEEEIDSQLDVTRTAAIPSRPRHPFAGTAGPRRHHTGAGD